LLNVLREFVLVRQGAAPGDDVLRIEDPRFRFAAGGPSRTLRRTWLDTFDWRLFRAGLTLEMVIGRGAAELVLTGAGGEIVAAEQLDSELSWPSLADGLPVGPLFERVAPVIGVRALLPVARARSSLSDRRALNSDDKTVALVSIDRMTVLTPRRGRQAGRRGSGTREPGAPPAGPPARIAVRPLRGYQVQAVKVAEVIAAAPNVAPATSSALETALAASGRRPGDYSSKINVQLTGDMPASLSIVTVLHALFDAVQVNLAGTLADIDSEFLHDLRVAVRRTRSVLKLGGAALPAGLVSRYRPEFKWLGDLTTPARDFDVYLLGYPAMADALVAASAEQLEPFRGYLEREHAAAHHALARGLRSVRFARLAAGWRADLERIAAAPSRRAGVARFAAKRIERAHKRVLADGAAIDATSPPPALHELRKRCKELRYLLEVFASLHSQSEQWRAVNELKALQDCLGEFQDTEVQHAELRDFAARMMAERSAPADTLLAMGEIAATLARRQAAARAEFAGRFADFSSPRGQDRIAVLTREGRPGRGAAA
jgi:CHAD domain-containing protein